MTVLVELKKKPVLLRTKKTVLLRTTKFSKRNKQNRNRKFYVKIY